MTPEQRLERLESLEAIRQLKYRYFHTWTTAVSVCSRTANR